MEGKGRALEKEQKLTILNATESGKREILSRIIDWQQDYKLLKFYDWMDERTDPSPEAQDKLKMLWFCESREFAAPGLSLPCANTGENGADYS